MQHVLDVFLIHSDGAVVWCFTAASLGDARTKINESKRPLPAEYLIVNLLTGERTEVRLVALEGARGASA